VDPTASQNVLEKKNFAPSPVEGPQFSFRPVYSSSHIIIIIITPSRVPLENTGSLLQSSTILSVTMTVQHKYCVWVVPYTYATERSPTDGEDDDDKEFSLFYNQYIFLQPSHVNKPKAVVTPVRT
jgi:hypothetical protein